MRSNRSTKLLTIALTAALVACSDAAVSPTAPAVESGARFGVSGDDKRDDDRDDKRGDEESDAEAADFTVTSAGGTFEIGPHAIHFPKRAICDPASSTYGPTEWDKPCTVADAPVRIHAELRTVGGYEWVEFSPALRFVPTRRVVVFMRATALDSGTRRTLNILWSPAKGAPGIDESLTDPTLRTHALPEHGLLYRRIKHFSGYQVSAGLSDILMDTLTVGTALQ